MPIPTGVITNAAFEGEIRTQVESLDAMFRDSGLTALRAKSPQHPAVVRRDMLCSFLPRRPRPYPELLAISGEIGSAMIDRQFWMPDPSTGDYWSFIPNVAAAERIAQNLHDPGRFEETLAEVRTWASLRHNGLAVELVEEEGRPDLPINRGTATETWAEVKFLHTTTTDQGALGALKKANRQLREATSEGAGIAYLYIERVHAPRALPAIPDEANAARLPSGDDPPPPDVERRLAVIEHALSGNHYKSIAIAILTWEDHGYIGTWPEPVTYFVRRQFLLRRHNTPRSVPPVTDEMIRLGGWSAFRLGITALR